MHRFKFKQETHAVHTPFKSSRMSFKPSRMHCFDFKPSSASLDLNTAKGVLLTNPTQQHTNHQTQSCESSICIPHKMATAFTFLASVKGWEATLSNASIGWIRLARIIVMERFPLSAFPTHSISASTFELPPSPVQSTLTGK